MALHGVSQWCAARAVMVVGSIVGTGIFSTPGVVRALHPGIPALIGRPVGLDEVLANR